jgi:tetratricopeptide (TPR) repeat protein
MRLLTAAGLYAGLALVGGCNRGVEVRVPTLAPALLPIRAFPEIWILAGDLPEEQALATALAAHLARAQRSRVEVVDAARWLALRESGQVGPVSVLVRLRLDFHDRTETLWTTRHEPLCDGFGCYSVPRSIPFEVPALKARLNVFAYDTHGGGLQQRVMLEAKDVGGTDDGMRIDVVAQLTEQLEAATEQRIQTLDIGLVPLDLPEGARALALAEAGRLRAALAMLEPWTRPEALRRLDTQTQARVLYDVAQLRRVVPARPAARIEQLALAREALQAAMRLDPAGRYAEALGALERQEQRLRWVRDQRDAAEHNFDLRRRLKVKAAAPEAPFPALPEPPPAYREPNGASSAVTEGATP